MNTKMFFASFIALFFIYSLEAQKGTVSSSGAFKSLTGCWQGTLNYSGTIIRKPFATTAQLVVAGKGGCKFVFVHVYTKDPRENVTDTITISNHEKELNHEMITSKRYNEEGSAEIITESQGFDHDNNTAATVRQTYTIGKDLYKYKKEVQLQGQTDWLDRQDFVYKRKPCL